MYKKMSVFYKFIFFVCWVATACSTEHPPVDNPMTPEILEKLSGKDIPVTPEILEKLSGKDIRFFTYGSEGFSQARERLANQAKSTGWFSHVTAHSPETLPELFAEHKTFFENNGRGGGYWLWKSYLILRELTAMPMGSYLVYADAGSYLNAHGVKRFTEYLDLISQENSYGILTFSLDKPEKCWTKSDVAKNLGVLEEKKIWQSEQRLGGIIILKKNEHTVNLIHEWYDLARAERYHYLDDSKSISQNDACFKEHRHDQSLYSLITKIRGAEVIPDETYPAKEGMQKGWPILATRMK